MSRDILKQALDALSRGYADAYLDGAVADSIREKLAKPEQEPVAALVEVRRTNGPWRRYSVYDTVAAAEGTKARTDGNGIEVRVVPLYRELT